MELTRFRSFIFRKAITNYTRTFIVHVHVFTLARIHCYVTLGFRNRLLVVSISKHLAASSMDTSKHTGLILMIRKLPLLQWRDTLENADCWIINKCIFCYIVDKVRKDKRPSTSCLPFGTLNVHIFLHILPVQVTV